MLQYFPIFLGYLLSIYFLAIIFNPLCLHVLLLFSFLVFPFIIFLVLGSFLVYSPYFRPKFFFNLPCLSYFPLLLSWSLTLLRTCFYAFPFWFFPRIFSFIICCPLLCASTPPGNHGSWWLPSSVEAHTPFLDCCQIFSFLNYLL